MQFIAKGPDIPEVLIDAHEDGRVVFFCGAGVSYPAGLPGFKKLVQDIYEGTGTKPNEIEQAALDVAQYDTALNLLEQRLPGQRIEMRKALQRALKPKIRRTGALDTHRALLQLGRQDGALRLVTTNFDLLFRAASRRFHMPISEYLAPSLPIPKNSRWDGLVYLHGRLPQSGENERDLNRLVVTSGDFGLAYLTERWAARFVSDLFRSYIVCFVGYSINDPVLRYMMDALAADRRLGETSPQAYAFGSCTPGSEDKEAALWSAKGVSPLLYDPTNDHAAMHSTLAAWADTYRDGVAGREAIIVNYALSRPSQSTDQDDHVGRVLWAMTHRSGLPAKRFAELDPTPPLEWLKSFNDRRFRYRDLQRFGVSGVTAEEKLTFSLALRPAPLRNAPWMSLVTHGPQATTWDQVMTQIARWLMNHINDPELLLWFAENGGQLHAEMKRHIQAAIQPRDSSRELGEAASTHLSNIVSEPLRALWRLLAQGLIGSDDLELNFYDWLTRLKQEGVSTPIRLELRRLLAPRLELRRALPIADAGPDVDEWSKIRRTLRFELALASDHIPSALRDLRRVPEWQSALPSLLHEFETLLTDALDLAREIDEASLQSDRSFWDLPSIEDHQQNRGFAEWVTLIELVRDAWAALSRTDKEKAECVAKAWLGSPYPTFKRLALFAAAQGGISRRAWVHFLVSETWWLWSIETQREVLRLFVQQGASLQPDERADLVASILRGPPRDMYRTDLEVDQWDMIVDRSIFIRLAKLAVEVGDLGSDAEARLLNAPAGYDGWQSLRHDERSEFSHWMSGSGDPDFEDRRRIDVAPTKREALLEWLQKPKPATSSSWDEDTWRTTCQKHPVNAGCALAQLASQNIWPADRWREALYAWSEKRLPIRTWRLFSPTISAMPPHALREVASGLSWWLEAVSKSTSPDSERFLALSSEIIKHIPFSQADLTVTAAINHPIGHVVQAALNLWFSRKPVDGQKLPDDISSFFLHVLNDPNGPSPGIIILAAHTIPLFRADPEWTKTAIIPLYDWTNTPFAQAVWEGFFWTARVHPQLFLSFKGVFLDTAERFDSLSQEAATIYTQLLTYAAISRIPGYEVKEFREAIARLPSAGLVEVAGALLNALESSGEKSGLYWTNRVLPFWRDLWPKDLTLASKPLSSKLARLAVAAGSQFPLAVEIVDGWLEAQEFPHSLISKMNSSNLPRMFPTESLRFLDRVISPDVTFRISGLQEALQTIAASTPEAVSTTAYRRLDSLVRLTSS